MKAMMTPDELKSSQEYSLLEYPLTPPPATGSVVEIANGILWVRMPMPMALDHINVYLLEDVDGWYIVDTGLNTEKTRQLWLQVIKQYCQNKTIKGIVCTHFHYDHSGLTSWLMQTFNAPLYMTYGEFYMLNTISHRVEALGNKHQLAFYHRMGAPRNEVDAMIDSCRNDPFIKHCPESFIRLRKNDVLTIGQRRWKIIIGEGHSPEHACLYCEKDKLLLSGDQLLPTISANISVTEMEPQAQPLTQWFRSLEQLKALDENTLVLPAHGPVFRQVHLRVQQLIDHHIEQLSLLKTFALQQKEFSTYQAMKYLFKRSRALSPIESMMALGETLAHLNWLEDSGDLTCQRMSDSGISTYLLTPIIKKTGGTL